MYKDITGIKFGKLTPLYVSGKSKSREYIWHCICDCGNETDVVGSSLRNGNTKSCGCLIYNGHPMNSTTHGMSKERIYHIWKSMKQRCINPKNISYKNYGGRNITVCDEWKNDFMTFYNWAINNGYKNNLSIERIDVNGNYCPENCCWVTFFEQQSNKTNNKYIEYNGDTYTLAQLSRKFNIDSETLRKRLKSGWSLEDALTIIPKIGNNQTLRKSD